MLNFFFLFIFFTGLIFISLLFYAYKNITRYVFPRYKINSKEKTSLEIFHLSDLHLDNHSGILKNLDLFFSKLEENLKQTQTKKILILTGDLISFEVKNKKHLKNLKKFLTRLQKYEKYFIQKFSVLGNHDQYQDSKENIQEILKSFHFNILDTPFSCLKFKEQSEKINSEINIIGLPDFTTHQPLYLENKPQEFLEKNLEKNKLNLILTHDAQAITKTLKKLEKENINFILFSGHTHGGQINLPIVRNLAFKYIHYTSKLKGGFYTLKKDQQFACISQGVGHSAIFPFRINASPEVPIIEI